ncbi:hypothetical protein AWC31_17880 [Mycolicibacterium wolinskyi]|uniref:Uncharacterized protein n=1 Tax=Mycolicibacterium wolinskyi TaxID=59750 RepID=A0A1X2FGU1_9MYCO|nr:hypothetical protein AWC31_17880 [Mycolicibacterium wolinskyi]
MQQALLVRVVKRASKSVHYLDNVFVRHSGWISLGQHASEVFAVDEVHRNPQLPVMLATVVDTDDTGMPQRGRQVRFSNEASPVSVIVGPVAGKKLKRVAPGQPGMLGEVHLAHATGPQ